MFINTLSKLLNFLPDNWKNNIMGGVLCYLPLWIIKAIPCSYSTYLKCYQPKKGDTVIDCGAHIGNCSILFSRLVGKDGIVVAIEPFEDSFNRLKRRINKFHKKNIIAINKGIWSTSATLPLNIFSDTIYCRIDKNSIKSSIDNNFVYIDCISLDELLEKLNLKQINMIKMDIEGAEIKALQGCRKTLIKYSPHFAIASYHIVDKKPTYHQVEKSLKDQNYLTYTFFPPHLTTCGKKI